MRLTASPDPTLRWPLWRLYRGKAWTRNVVTGPVQIYCDQGSGIARKVFAGYQGWFACPGTGAPPGAWVHWFDGQVPDADHATFDLWPDTSDLTPGERCPTAMTLPDGSRATLYSSTDPTTVERHVAWMQQYGIDGVFYQRFLSTLDDPELRANRDLVLQNLLKSAARHGRKVAVAWDVSGVVDEPIRAAIARDWHHLVDDLHVTSSPAYLYDHGRPLVEIWGLGFTHVNAASTDVEPIVRDFHQPTAPRFAARVVGGVSSHWHELIGDSRPDPGWGTAYGLFDVLHPWPLGREWDDASVDQYRLEGVDPDLAITRSRGQEYMATVYPGFSWHNLLRTRGQDWPLNQIPRQGGRLLWREGWSAVDAGVSTIYVAMFDEVDEGTAIFKTAPTQATVPVQGRFLTLDADGEQLPSDWYLQVTGEIGRMLRGKVAPQPDLPLRPSAAMSRQSAIASAR